MSARFLPEADAEFREAARYYEHEAPGVGLAFIAEVHRLVALLEELPEMGARLEPPLRRVVLRRFPYNLLYSLEPDGLLVVAVAHHRRRPYYWRARDSPDCPQLTPRSMPRTP